MGAVGQGLRKMQAADAGGNDPNVYLDCAECLLVSDQDLDEAEAAARTVLTLAGVDQEALDQARLLLAQIRLADDDAEEALELLDNISAARKDDPVFLSTLKASRDAFAARHPDIAADADGARVLRSVLMKPESEHHIEYLHTRVEQLTQLR